MKSSQNGMMPMPRLTGRLACFAAGFAGGRAGRGERLAAPCRLLRACRRVALCVWLAFCAAAVRCRSRGSCPVLSARRWPAMASRCCPADRAPWTLDVDTSCSTAWPLRLHPRR